MSDRIPISIEIGLPGIDETLKKLEALKSNLRTLGEREAEVPVGAPRIREIAPAAVISTGQLQNLTRAMAEQIGVGRISGATFEDLNDMMKSVGLSGRQQRMIWEMLASGMDETGEKAGALATHYAYVNRRLGEIRDQQRSFMAMLGPTGVGVMRLSRSLFWLGLGSMFITMSWSRMRRRGQQIETQTYSLKRAYQTAEDAQRNLTEAIWQFGRGSREVIEASRGLEDANERVKMAEDSLRMAMEQKIYATWMWILGAAPTYLRTAVDVTSALWTTFSAEMAVVTARGLELVVMPGLTAAMIRHLPWVTSVAGAYWTMAAAVGAMTLGLSILMSVLMQRRAMQQAERRIKKIREEIEETTDSLVGHSLVDAIKETYSEMERLDKIIFELPLKAGSPLEVKTRWGGWTEIPEILEGPRITVPRTTVETINVGGINIYATVRDDRDIYKIKKELNEVFRGKLLRRRGRLF